ncbi:MAG: RpiB/LacA/LacB family sugar-phosphate isomerase [Armatimonadota bacterium]|nr:RpiB/LacA/LacB family sugar-phosphate isomerase [Armatimonadota bacterium]
MCEGDDTRTARSSIWAPSAARRYPGSYHQGDREGTRVIGLGSDHNGFRLKGRLLSLLVERDECVRDFGVFSDTPVDYPDIAAPLAEAVREGVIERGILVCGTGLGMAIAANKVPGVYAAPVTDVYTARKAWESNRVQVITLGAWMVDAPLGLAIVEAWLQADFRGGDSARKVAKIRSLEMRYSRSAGRALPVGAHPW